MEECHKMLTAQVDWTIPEGDHVRIDVNRPLPLSGPPGHGSNPALSISKMKAASYPDFGLELLVPEQMWIDDVCTYGISAKYGISYWWFNRQKFYINRHDSPSRRKDVRTHMRILSVVRIKAYSRYGYDYLSKIVLRRANFQEYTIAEKDFKNMYRIDFEDLNLLLLQGHLDHLHSSDKRMLSTTIQLNLTKPGWDATGYEFKHDYSIIESPRAVVFPVDNNDRKITRFNEIYKFSDGMLTRILEALDYRVKEFKVKRLNLGMNTRFWTQKDVTRSKEFITAIERRLKTRRIFPETECLLLVKRTIYQRTTPKNSDFKEKVNTAKVNNVTTAGTKAVVSVVQGHEENAVKSSACWIWRPTGKVIDHISKDSGSYMPKRFDYGNPQYALQDQGIFDSGCSRHMTGNKSYLTDYQDIDGGFVAFAGSPKGGKITRKGKIRTGKLDFKDVYFVKELKFNLFSVSQMCDKKNSVLFTKTECLILSPNFKLLDESQVLLKVPRQNNMYSFNLKNVVPSGGIENQINHKVKIIRCDNRAEFKNSEMNQFCKMKGIKREFSVARTPKQNRLAKRKNRTLIDVARTMLADSLLPTTFWAEAINTACYVHNRVLIIKPHNKIPYKLLIGRSPNLNFMRPFGCPVTILNTLYRLGKFEGKDDERFLVGYSVNSKAFRVFNTRTKKVEENLHIKFLENKPNVIGSGPEWLFDIDSLTKSMNYEPVSAGNQTNDDAGIETNVNAVQTRHEKASNHEYILLPFLTSDSQGPKSSDDEFVDDARKKNDAQYPTKDGDKNGLDKDVRDQEEALRNQFDQETKRLVGQGEATITNSTNTLNTVCLSISAIGQSFDNNDLLTNPFTPDLEDSTSIFRGAYDDEDVGAEADLNNLETIMNVNPIPTTRIHKDHPKDQIIRDINSAIQTWRMINFFEENSIVSYISKQRRTNHKDYHNCLFANFLSQIEPKKVWTLVDLLKGKRAIGTKWVYRNKNDERGIVVRNKARLMDVKSAFLYGTIEEEVYVCQPLGFEDPQFPDKVYKVEKALYGLNQAPRACYETLSTYLIENGFRRGTVDKTLFIKKDKDDILLAQVYVDDIIFGSTKKSLCDEFEQMMHKKFQMSFMGELTFFLGLQTASTPMEPNKALVKDEEADSVDVHLYRSMIRSLMYLIASRPDITFVVCACARDSPFDLEAFSDSDYAGASLDRKSITGGCQFLGKRLISWQCKKQTIVANSTTEAEYVAAANCCGQVLWIQNQMLDYGFNFMHTKIYIDNESTICIVKKSVFHSKTKHIEIRHHFIRDSYEKKLIQVIKIHTDHNVADLLTKAFDVSRANLSFVNQHNMVAYLEKSDKNAEFHQIFWNTTTSKILNSVKKIHAIVDGKALVITKSSVRNDLLFDDEDGNTCLTNDEIFENLALMGYEQLSTKLTFQKGGDSVERAITTNASLVAAQDSDNIIRTQTTTMPYVDIPQGMDTGGSLRRQETMGVLFLRLVPYEATSPPLVLKAAAAKNNPKTTSTSARILP
ncbi:putative ribonuclease H-like domain-containing protein [Tanacetum coccineum]